MIQTWVEVLEPKGLPGKRRKMGDRYLMECGQASRFQASGNVKIVPEGPRTSSTRDRVEQALNDGRKAALVEALELVGMNPDDYLTNAERKDALLTWLGG